MVSAFWAAVAARLAGDGLVEQLEPGAAADRLVAGLDDLAAAGHDLRGEPRARAVVEHEFAERVGDEHLLARVAVADDGLGDLGSGDARSLVGRRAPAPPCGRWPPSPAGPRPRARREALRTAPEIDHLRSRRRRRAPPRPRRRRRRSCRPRRARRCTRSRCARRTAAARRRRISRPPLVCSMRPSSRRRPRLSRSSTYTSAKSPPRRRARAMVASSSPPSNAATSIRPAPKARRDLRGRGLQLGDPRVARRPASLAASSSAELHRRAPSARALAAHVHGGARKGECTTATMMTKKRMRRRSSCRLLSAQASPRQVRRSNRSSPTAGCGPVTAAMRRPPARDHRHGALRVLHDHVVQRAAADPRRTRRPPPTAAAAAAQGGRRRRTGAANDSSPSAQHGHGLDVGGDVQKIVDGLVYGHWPLPVVRSGSYSITGPRRARPHRPARTCRASRSAPRRS